MKDFYRVKKQAEFMAWVEGQQMKVAKKEKDEVEYF